MISTNKTQFKISLYGLLSLTVFSCIFSLLSGVAELTSLIRLVLLLTSNYILASWFLSKIKTLNSNASAFLSLPLTYMLMTALFVTLPLKSEVLNYTVLVVITILAILVFWKQSVLFSRNPAELIPALVSCVIITVFFRLPEALSPVPIMYENLFQDNYWFTAMTASIRDGDFSTSLYESGTGVYHHILGLFPAAVISQYCSFPTHTSLWSITMPLGILSAVNMILALAFSINSKSISIKHQLVTLTAVFFLFPINPKYLLSGRVLEMVWFGPGLTLPVLPTWVAVYVFTGFMVLLLIHAKSIKPVVRYALSLAFGLALAWSKITSYAVFIGLAGLFLLIYERRIFTVRQKTLLVGLAPVIVLILTFYSNSSAKFLFEPGYILDHFSVGGSSNLHWVKAIGIALGAFVVWAHIKLSVILAWKDKIWKSLYTTFVIGLLGCIAILGLLRIKSFTPSGTIGVDSSFDLLQFTRSTFIYVAIGFGLFISAINSKQILPRDRLKKIVNSLVIIWGGVVISISVLAIKDRPQTFHENYFREVVTDLRKFPHAKKAMISNATYSGQFIAAHDIGPFYTSIIDRNGGYTYSYEFVDRYNRFKSFILGKNPEMIDELKEHGVTIMVATPSTQNHYDQLVKQNVLKKVNQTDWLYTYD